ncbi:MAG: glycosyltransferase [Streptococcus parauberis]
MQKQKFTETVYKESGVRPNVQVIPVGSVDLKEPSHHQRKHFSMMTASRLQARKRVDWLIRAAILAKKDIPQLEFSIYGRGSEQEKLENIINEHNAQNYIFLKGHADLDDVYPQYELYVSASSWETFGLSLLEAVSHGLAMIGLNVPYGNPTFIESDSNGFLVDYEYLSDEQITIQALADKIITYFKLPETVRQSFNDKSFEIAEQFTKDKVKQVWLELLEN